MNCWCSHIFKWSTIIYSRNNTTVDNLNLLNIIVHEKLRKLFFKNSLNKISMKSGNVSEILVVVNESWRNERVNMPRQLSICKRLKWEFFICNQKNFQKKLCIKTWFAMVDAQFTIHLFYYIIFLWCILLDSCFFHLHYVFCVLILSLIYYSTWEKLPLFTI